MSSALGRPPEPMWTSALPVKKWHSAPRRQLCAGSADILSVVFGRDHALEREKRLAVEFLGIAVLSRRFSGQRRRGRFSMGLTLQACGPARPSGAAPAPGLRVVEAVCRSAAPAHARHGASPPRGLCGSLITGLIHLVESAHLHEPLARFAAQPLCQKHRADQRGVDLDGRDFCSPPASVNAGQRAFEPAGIHLPAP